jgi:Domain of unknown function (DUF4048)
METGAAINTESAISPQNAAGSSTFEQPNLKRPPLSARSNVAERHLKRLTLSFPMSPPIALRSEQSSPSSSLITPATESSLKSSPVCSASAIPSSNDSLNDDYDFLTAIASQERRVLELREELQRAESELASLKKQWTLTERARKRTEINHHAELMKPLKLSAPDPAADSPTIPGRNDGGVDSSATQARISRELERRGSLRTTAAATASRDVSISANGRRLFPSSKHTRTLSLLSPDIGEPVHHKSLSPSRTPDDKTFANGQASRYPRAATLPSMERSSPTKASSDGMKSPNELPLTQWRRSLPPPSREVLMRTGKQMASDLRDGLWTFFEDIRQATVGEEGINATQSRTVQPTPGTKSRSNLTVTPKSGEQLATGIARSNSSSPLAKERAAAATNGKDEIQEDAEASFWREFGVDTPGQKSKITTPTQNTSEGRKKPEDSNLLDLDDNWDMWDTPQPSKIYTPSSSHSTIESKRGLSPSTQQSTPRTSTRYVF